MTMCHRHSLASRMGGARVTSTDFVYRYWSFSAYTPAGYVSNANHDFGSMLRFVETTFGYFRVGPDRPRHLG
jgi:hypothetical protein